MQPSKNNIGLSRVLATAGPLDHELQVYGDGLAEIHDPTDHRKRFKEFLRKFRHHDEFYTEVELKTRTIVWSMGIRDWLGQPRPEDYATSMDYLEKFVHPFAREYYRYYVKAMTAVFVERTYTKPLTIRFSISVPMHYGRNKYLLVKMMSMPFGLTEKGKIGSLLNSYSSFGPYKGEAISIDVFDGNKKMDEKHDDTIRDFRQKLVPCLSADKKLRLSTNDVKYADYISRLNAANQRPNLHTVLAFQKEYEKRKDLTQAQVQKAIDRLYDRVKYILGFERLDATAKDIHDPFLPDFSDPYHLIQYCIDSGIIELLKSRKRQKTKPSLTDDRSDQAIDKTIILPIA